MKFYNILIIFIITFIAIEYTQTAVTTTPQASQSSDGKGVPLARSAIMALPKKVQQIITMIKCIIKCFVQYLSANVCKQMFPCIYDCMIGQELIPDEIDKQIDTSDSKLSYPKGMGLGVIYKVFQCFYDCSTEKPISDWKSLSFILYCFVDQCICFTIFGAEAVPKQ